MNKDDARNLKKGDRIICVDDKRLSGEGKLIHLTQGKLYTVRATLRHGDDAIYVSDCDNGPNCYDCNDNAWLIKRFEVYVSEEEVASSKKFNPDILDVADINFKVNHES